MNVDKDAEVAAGPAYAEVFQAAAEDRELARGSTAQDWNQATNMVITDQAGGQIMGDWAQGEFQVAGEVAGEDYTCLPGLGINESLDTGGDAFYFPVIDDPEVKEAQMALASTLIAPETQAAFNLEKGSLPVRGDIDLSGAHACMQKGLEILESGGVMPPGEMSLTPDTVTQIEDLQAEFWSSDMDPAAAQERFAEIIADAD